MRSQALPFQKRTKLNLLVGLFSYIKNFKLICYYNKYTILKSK
jgi:hypothetical protein